MARQAHGDIWIQSGDTVVLVTAVTQTLTRDIDFLPLVVDYQEMSYASGRIPGSYFRREIGRPSERETLVSRLIDRPIRPLFPTGFFQEIQVIATVLSADPDYDPDVLAITGASAALHISKIPFQGPIAGARVGYVDERFILNPTQEELKRSAINIVMAGSHDAVVMVEGESTFASEELLAEALSFGHEKMQPLIDLQHELRGLSGKPKIEVKEPEQDAELIAAVQEVAAAPLDKALRVEDKIERKEAKSRVKEDVLESLSQRFPEEPERLNKVSALIKDLESDIVRGMIREDQTRIDGRDLTTVRELNMEVGLLPRVHGSALFTRGETKALGVATLGSARDEQRMETLSGEQNKRFMLHYNFPPYCVGEVKMLRGPARGEIGHGVLAERSLTPVLPSAEDFPFTIRIVSEVMESNGSSSMATVCAGSLALMDAGVPITAPVAGIAMGLIKEQDDYFILTDILGDEDHLGDMDFKVAGTKDGITGIQMDIKISGIPADILGKALIQARTARLHILKQMETVLPVPRSDLSEHAPQYRSIEVSTDKIKDVIGPGGKHIKAITQETGASIDIDDNGVISVFAPDSQALEHATEMILFYDQKAEVGKDYDGKVKNVKDFGAFVEILPGLEGLVHISQMDIGRVEDINKVVNVGDEMKVKVIEIDERTGKIRLSRKAVLLEEKGETFDLENSGRPSGNRDRRPNPRNRRS
ncbi:MAG: polyribonucleotide nucleotidyltransferase [Desulfohalobiaceae bacterium]|nr:polyribonucleotide nucleotidyltransferase [Desulfohalobiaceae bacterium]